MARSARYRVPFRRKRIGKTDYKKRLRFLLSKTPRLAVRKSLRSIVVQLIEYSPAGDRVVASAHSRELRKYGWLGSGSNTSAAYLVGLLCARKALEKNHSKAILDIGFHAPTKGSKIFAALRGALDGGLEIPHQEDLIPDDSRIHGEHVAAYAKLVDKSKRFSKYLERNLDPETLPGHFEEVKKRIMGSKG
jgi:large subunit ribosomal protein L18